MAYNFNHDDGADEADYSMDSTFLTSPKDIKPVFDMKRKCVSEFEIRERFTGEKVVDVISQAYYMGIISGACNEKSYRILAGDRPGDNSGDAPENYFEEISRPIEMDIPGIGRVPGEAVELRRKYNHLPEFFFDRPVELESIRTFVRDTLAGSQNGIADFRFPDAWIGVYKDKDRWVFDNLQPSYFLWAYAHFL